jgi:ketosteroid isomerase-like protein
MLGGGSMTKTLAALMPMLVVASPSFAQTSEVQRALIRLEDQWALAVRLSDTMALNLIIADDYIGTTATGQIQTKADYLADFTSGDRRVLTLTTEDLEVRVYGHVAVLTHGGHAEAEYRGSPVAGEFRWTHVVLRRDGQWQAVANHVTRIPRP